MKNKMSTSDVCFACLVRPCELFVGTLISLTNAYAGYGRPTLDFIERFDLGRSVPTAKPLHLVSVGHNVCTDYVDQFSMNMCLKMFCTRCLIILSIILCDTSKASENLIFCRCRKSALLRTLIGSHAVCRSRAPDSASVRINGEV